MYQYYLDGVLFPISPEENEENITNRNEKFTCIDGQEKNIAKIPGLTTYKADFYAPVCKPTKKPDYALNNLSAAEIEKLINRWKQPQYAVIDLFIKRFEQNQNAFYTHDKVTLETCAIRESRSHNGLVLFEMTFQQYNDSKTEIFSAEKQEDGSYDITVEQKRERTDNREIPETVTVQRGDTLWAIARKYLNDGEKYHELQKINGIVNPNRLQIGQIIKLR